LFIPVDDRNVSYNAEKPRKFLMDECALTILNSE
jgi:hypothetical protein